MEGKLEAKEAHVKTLQNEKYELRKESNLIKTLENKLEKQKQELEDKRPEKWAFIYTVMALGVCTALFYHLYGQLQTEHGNKNTESEQIYKGNEANGPQK